MKLTLGEYIAKHEDEPAWSFMMGDPAESSYLRSVEANEEGFIKMLTYLVLYMDVELSWVFDVFMDGWQKFYKVVNGEEMNIGCRFI